MSEEGQGSGSAPRAGRAPAAAPPPLPPACFCRWQPPPASSVYPGLPELAGAGAMDDASIQAFLRSHSVNAAELARRARIVQRDTLTPQVPLGADNALGACHKVARMSLRLAYATLLRAHPAARAEPMPPAPAPAATIFGPASWPQVQHEFGLDRPSLVVPGGIRRNSSAPTLSREDDGLPKVVVGICGEHLRRGLAWLPRAAAGAAAGRPVHADACMRAWS